MKGLYLNFCRCRIVLLIEFKLFIYFQEIMVKKDGKKNILLFIGVYYIYVIEENIFIYFYFDFKNNVGVMF